MWNRFRSLFKADIKFIAGSNLLLFVMLTPLLLILLLRLGYPLLSDFIFLKTGFLLYNYYTIIAITIVSVIPVLFGTVYALIFIRESNPLIHQINDLTSAGRKNFIYIRMIIPAVFSFIIVLFSIILTNPVPTEGWLRSIFVSILLSVQSSFVFLFIGSVAGTWSKGIILSKLYGIILATVPLGLLLHHPWNYFVFFSPLYWISWTWVTPVIGESLLYGSISIIITFGCILIFFRHFLKKHAN